MTVITQPPKPLESAASSWVSGEQHLLLNHVGWQAYLTIGSALRDRSGLRLTYDKGRLEFMTLSPEHERSKALLRRLIEILAEEMNLPLASFGSTTYQREDLARGLEPDECFYLANHVRMRGVQRIDLTRDPPPDLAVEVDVTQSSLDRMSIYASLGVSELWRFEGETLRAYQLGANQTYEAVERSGSFPSVPLVDFPRFVQQGLDEDDTSMARAFRAWVREQLARK